MWSGARKSQESRSSVIDPLRLGSLDAGLTEQRSRLEMFAVVFGVIFGIGTILIVLGAPDWLLIVAGALVGHPAVRFARRPRKALRHDA